MIFLFVQRRYWSSRRRDLCSWLGWFYLLSNALPDANPHFFYSPTVGTGWLIAPLYLLTGDGFAKSDASAYRFI